MDIKEFKVIGTIFWTAISWIIGGIGYAFAGLLLMMILDFATGMLVGAHNQALSSDVGRKGLIKKVYIIILVSSVYLMEAVAQHMTGQGFEFLNYTGDGIAVTFIIIEFVSIAENGGKLGLPIPTKILNSIAIFKGKDSDTN